MSKIVGIDLGTTLSEVAVVESGAPKIIEDHEGSRTTPSVVAMSRNGERLVGVSAKRQQVTNPQNTLFGIKRLIGRRFSDLEVQRDMKLYPYEIKAADDGGVLVKMADRWYKPAEISAMVLQKIKADVEQKLGQKVEEAIITCPAYFDDSQRKATKIAGEIAGFKVHRIINEPTAAALAYGLNKKGERKILVYDFGGGTFDVSVLDISEDTIEVKSTGGDNHLGGEDFDQKITQWLIDEFKKDQGVDLSKDPLALQRLKESAEKAKIELSTTQESEINLPFISSDAQGPKHLLYKLSRAKLEELTGEFVSRSIELVRSTLKEAKFEPNQIDEVLLVGGQTRMPKIRQEVKAVFGKEPKIDINPDEVVALGAAIQGAILQGEVKDVLLLDVTPLSLGIETLGGVNTVLIAKNTTVPTSKSQVFSTAADSQTSVEIHVVQGERALAKDNKSLGRFILDGIPPAPRGIPQVEVSFDIDANGILNVTAKDKASNKTQSIRIEGSTGMSSEEVEKLKNEALKHAQEDEQNKQLIEARNLADTAIYTAEKTLKEAGEKADRTLKGEVESKLKTLREIKDSEQLAQIKKASEELSAALQKLGEALHKQTDGNASGQPADDKKADSGPQQTN